MGMFKSAQKSASETVYKKEVLPNLHEKDGYTHVIMVTSFSKFLNQNFGVETKYTTQIDYIVTEMQKAGYEIKDITHTTLKNQGLFGDMEGFHSLITYK